MSEIVCRCGIISLMRRQLLCHSKTQQTSLPQCRGGSPCRHRELQPGVLRRRLLHTTLLLQPHSPLISLVAWRIPRALTQICLFMTHSWVFLADWWFTFDHPCPQMALHPCLLMPHHSRCLVDWWFTFDHQLTNYHLWSPVSTNDFLQTMSCRLMVHLWSTASTNGCLPLCINGFPLTTCRLMVYLLRQWLPSDYVLSTDSLPLTTLVY